MVAGHLTKRNGYYYAVLSYYDPDGKRHFKTISTGLKVVSGNYRKAELFATIQDRVLHAYMYKHDAFRYAFHGIPEEMA